MASVLNLKKHWQNRWFMRLLFPMKQELWWGRSSKSEGAQEIEGELHVSYRLSGVISGRQASFSFSMAVYSYQFMATRMLQESKVERPLDFMSHLPSVGIGAPSAGVGSACHQVVKARKAVALFLWKNRFDPGDPNSPRGFFVTYPLHEAKSDMSMWPYVQSTERMREREREDEYRPVTTNANVLHDQEDRPSFRLCCIQMNP